MLLSKTFSSGKIEKQNRRFGPPFVGAISEERNWKHCQCVCVCVKFNVLIDIVPQWIQQN